MATVAIRIGTRQLNPQAHTRPIYETRADGGMGAASFTLHIGMGMAPIGVRRDALVQISIDSQWVWSGRINDIDPGSWGIVCRPLQDDFTTTPALTAGGALTRDVEVAIDTARSAPFSVPIGNARGLDGVVYGDDTEPVMVAHLLNLLAEQESARWGIDADRQLWLRDDPTTPKWMIHAPDLVLVESGGLPYNGYAGRYVDIGTSLYATAYSTPAAGMAPKYANVDLTKRGAMTGLDATAVLNHLASMTRDRPTWGSELVVGQADIRTMGDQPAALCSVKGGDMARLVGLSTTQQVVAGGDYLDVVLGSVVHDTGTKTLTLAPVGTVPLTVEDALKAIA